MIVADEIIRRYFKTILGRLDAALEVAKHARSRGIDPHPIVEIKTAKDAASRVEGLVGPKGIAEKIRAYDKQGMPRELIAYNIINELITNANGKQEKELEKIIDQALRTGVGILTEGVLVAPTEGIAHVRLKHNPDGTSYLAVYYSGPIRSAGGTVEGLSVALADIIRKKLGIGNYRPTDTEIERYIEEIYLYDARCARLQYRPTEEEIRTIVKHCPVCITGEPTNRIEVSVYKNVPGIETNFVRGGMALVIGEGIAQKAPKILRFAKNVGLNWDWLESIIKIGSSDESLEILPNKKFLGDVIAGRPIISYPMAKGGFRLRYGRSRATGIMAKGLHPATMILSDGFIAIGTQMKIERPGKGCIATPCDSIEGPIVLLKDGSVVKVSSVDMAERIKQNVRKILFLGDILTPIGDFIKSGHPFVPSAWCEEWWVKECIAKGLNKNDLVKVDLAEPLNAMEHIEFSKRYDIPLHPEYTFHWHDVNPSDLLTLAEWFAEGQYFEDMYGVPFPINSEDDDREITNAKEGKRVLEELCVPHNVFEIDSKHWVMLNVNYANVLITCLGGAVRKKDAAQSNKAHIERDKVETVIKELKSEFNMDNPGDIVIEAVNMLSGLKIKKKVSVYIGARMGRPEKAKKRKMHPPVHVLFPLGHTIRTRDMIKLYNMLKEKTKTEGKGIKVEIARRKCTRCGTITPYNVCENCGEKTKVEMLCPKCGRRARDGQNSGVCVCGGKLVGYDRRVIDFIALFNKARKNIPGRLPDSVKGIKGMINKSKMPEHIEKGLLRARHGITVFRDGTCRFDATDAPLTHFKPCEIGVTVDVLMQLGYETDYKGNKLTNNEQIIELFPQDIIVPYACADFLVKTANFIDDMLVYMYSIEPYYNAKTREDMIGKLVITQSPHTSAGILSRVIGFTSANVCYAHPYLICGRRRNCDGDEDSIALLLDALINFSHEYLPSSRGGTMDTPILLTTVLDPKEVDDEVHAMDITSELPLEFYHDVERYKTPNIKLVRDVLGKPEQYCGLGFVHDTSDINSGSLRTSYVMFKTMKEKIDAQFEVEEKLRAVDVADAAERLILSHFLPDLYGNLRAFSRQTLRCVHCNTKYRRPPLSGRCTKCGGKITLTVYQGGIEKYLNLAVDIIDKYKLPNYLRQRLMLLRRDLKSIFDDELKKQLELTQFM